MAALMRFAHVLRGAADDEDEMPALDLPYDDDDEPNALMRLSVKRVHSPEKESEPIATNRVRAALSLSLQVADLAPDLPALSVQVPALALDLLDLPGSVDLQICCS